MALDHVHRHFHVFSKITFKGETNSYKVEQDKTHSRLIK